MRHGFAALPVLGCLAVAFILVVLITDTSARRSRQIAHRQLTLQARELALGMLAFPVGSELDIAGWHLRRDVDGAEACGSRGHLRLGVDGNGRWESAP
jgi:hypothetical protein